MDVDECVQNEDMCVQWYNPRYDNTSRVVIGVYCIQQCINTCVCVFTGIAITPDFPHVYLFMCIHIYILGNCLLVGHSTTTVWHMLHTEMQITNDHKVGGAVL